MWDKHHLKACTESNKPSKGCDEPGDLLSVLSRGIFPKHLRRYLKGASGLKQLSRLVCCLKKFQKLGLYTRFFLLLALVCLFITLCRFIQFSPTISPKQQPSWVIPEDCIAEDCHLKDPLPLSELSPNLLLVLIHARGAGGKGRRDAIRKTWLSGLSNQPDSPIQFRFVIGGEDLPAALFEAIVSEGNIENDILLFPTVTDSIYSLTTRTLLSFKYAYKWFDYEYVLKCDDDTFVDIRRIATELQQRNSRRPLYWGYMTGSSSVNHFGRYSEFNWDVCDRYVTYALGGGYVLSNEVTRILDLVSEHLRIYVCEDVALGAWLAPYNLELKHDSRFNTNTPSRGCKEPYLVSHKVSADEMFTYHDSLVSEGRMCSWRTYSYRHRGYIYNWTARATSCCSSSSLVP